MPKISMQKEIKMKGGVMYDYIPSRMAKIDPTDRMAGPWWCMAAGALTHCSRGQTLLFHFSETVWN